MTSIPPLLEWESPPPPVPSRPFGLVSEGVRNFEKSMAQAAKKKKKPRKNEKKIGKPIDI